MMAALAEIGFAGPLNLEIPGENAPVPELIRGKIRHALEVTQWLIAQAAGE